MAEVGFRKWIITLTVVSAAVMELIDTSIVNVALSEMSGNLGATLEDTAWVVTSYAIANVIIIPMTSFLAARIGRRRYYIGSIIVFTLASFMCGAARNIWLLVAFRFLQGLGGGGLLSTSQAILFEAFPPQERGLASGMFGLGIVIGPTIGPTLGGYIVDSLSWPWIFYVNIPIGIVATMLSLLYVRDDVHAKKPTSIDWLGIGLLVAFVGSLQVVLERGQSEDWFDTPYITVLSAVAVITGVWFVYHELNSQAPVVDLRVLTRSRTLVLAAILTFSLGCSLFSSVFIVPVFCQRLLGYTALQTGLLLLPGAIVAGFLLPNIGRMIGKGVSPKPLVFAGFVLTALFTIMFSRQNLQSGSAQFFWPLIIRGIGIACLTVPLTVLAVSDLQPRDIAQGAALNNMMRQLGGGFGIAMVNTYIAHRSAEHRNALISHVSLLDPATQERIGGVKGALLGRGVPPGDLERRAYGALEGAITRQQFLMSYLDAFFVVGLISLACAPLVLLVPRKKQDPAAARAAMAEAH